MTIDNNRPGKPTDNVHIEIFNGRFRNECLNQHIFETLNDAKEKIEAWRKDYNLARPTVHWAGLRQPPIRKNIFRQGRIQTQNRYSKWGMLKIAELDAHNPKLPKPFCRVPPIDRLNGALTSFKNAITISIPVIIGLPYVHLHKTLQENRKWAIRPGRQTS